MLINLITAIIIVWMLGMVPMFLVFKKIMTSGQDWETSGRYMKRHYINNCVMAAGMWPIFLSLFVLSYPWNKEKQE